MDVLHFVVGEHVQADAAAALAAGEQIAFHALPPPEPGFDDSRQGNHREAASHQPRGGGLRRRAAAVTLAA